MISHPNRSLGPISNDIVCGRRGGGKTAPFLPYWASPYILQVASPDPRPLGS